jgi:hypothetical protein
MTSNILEEMATMKSRSRVYLYYSSPPRMKELGGGCLYVGDTNGNLEFVKKVANGRAVISIMHRAKDLLSYCRGKAIMSCMSNPITQEHPLGSPDYTRYISMFNEIEGRAA